jgi:elongation factor 1-gamma
MDEKLRKHSLGVLGVYGDEPNLEIIGVFIWRGTEIPEPMQEHPQFEYYTKKKLDVSNENNRKLAEEYLSKKEDEIVEGRKCLTKKLYK